MSEPGAGVRADQPLLAGADVSKSFGGLRVLHRVGFAVAPREIVALIGPNGAGKTTLLKAITGLLRPRSGAIRWVGEDLGSLPPHVVVERGIAMVSEGRRLFGAMTVEENLELGAYLPRARAETRPNLERVYAIFPRLRERRRQLTHSLSGG